MNRFQARKAGLPFRSCYLSGAHASHTYTREIEAPGLLQILTMWCPGVRNWQYPGEPTAGHSTGVWDD